MNDREKELWAELGRSLQRVNLATKKAMVEMNTFGVGAVSVRDHGVVEHQSLKSMFDFSYQAEVDIKESFGVPVELLTCGSYLNTID